MLELYKDEFIIAVDKSAGLLTIPDGYKHDLPNVKNILKETYPEIFTVHRLDKETSGVLLFALTAPAHRAMSMLFESRQVSKEYRAVVHGIIEEQLFKIDFPLLINGDRNHRTVVNSEHGKTAATQIEFISSLIDKSLIKAYPLTGYRHQIRAHLAVIGHPILGDQLYAEKKALSFETDSRLALHAHHLSFIHPFTQKQIDIVAPIPDDLLILMQ